MNVYRIKPLEFDDRGVSQPVDGIWYSVEWSNFLNRWRVEIGNGDRAFDTLACSSLEHGKSLCQEDWMNRISSALENDIENTLEAERAELWRANRELQSDLLTQTSASSQLREDKHKLLEALEESHALNINVFSDAEPEMLSYYSEHRSVMQKCKETLFEVRGSV